MLQKWKLKGSQTKDVSPFQGHFHGRKFTLQEKAEMTSHSRGVAGREGGYSEFCWGGGCTDGKNVYFLLLDFTFDPERCPPNHN